MGNREQPTDQPTVLKKADTRGWECGQLKGILPNFTAKFDSFRRTRMKSDQTLYYNFKPCILADLDKDLYEINRKYLVISLITFCVASLVV